MKRNMLVILALVSLLLLVFAGCGKSEMQQTNSNTSTIQGTDASADEGFAAAEQVEDDFNLSELDSVQKDLEEFDY